MIVGNWFDRVFFCGWFLCRDVAVCFEDGGEDLWDGSCEDTGFVLYQVCKAFGIYICIGFLDDGTFDKFAKVECAYSFLL